MPKASIGGVAKKISNLEKMIKEEEHIIALKQENVIYYKKQLNNYRRVLKKLWESKKPLMK